MLASAVWPGTAPGILHGESDIKIHLWRGNTQKPKAKPGLSADAASFNEIPRKL